MEIRDYLLSRRVHFEHLMHQPAASASRRAQSLHIPGRMVAKTVLVEASRGFVLVVLPSTHRVDLERLRRTAGGTPAAHGHGRGNRRRLRGL